MANYTPLVTKRNDKDRQLTILSQQGCKSTSRPDFQANTRPRIFFLKAKIQEEGNPGIVSLKQFIDV